MWPYQTNVENIEMNSRVGLCQWGVAGKVQGMFAPRYSETMQTTSPLAQQVASSIQLVTPTQYAILEHLAAVAIQQKAEARASKQGFRGGWTYLRPTQRIKLASIQALIRLGLVQPCCSGHFGTDTMRISVRGVELLEEVRGEAVLA
jgi:hypothetical protein